MNRNKKSKREVFARKTLSSHSGKGGHNMTMSRKMLLFLFTGLILLMIVNTFTMAVFAQRVASATTLLNQDQVLDPAFGYLMTGSLIIGIAQVIIALVLVWELGKEKITLDVNLHETQ